jgi:hypothetical protein
MSVESAVQEPLIEGRGDSYRRRQHTTPKRAIFYLDHHYS